MKTLFEELGGTYTQQGDYYLPDIKLPEQPEYEIGVWGQRRRRYLKEHHRIKYYTVLTKCTLYPHLAEVDQQAQELFFRLVEQHSEPCSRDCQCRAYLCIGKNRALPIANRLENALDIVI